MLEAIENAKKLVMDPSWPRPIDKFPKDSNVNCWGFALDGMKIPVLQERTYYSEITGLSENLFNFFKSIGLNPRVISTVEQKSPDELVFLFYIYEYKYSDFINEIWETRTECHAARIELNGTVVEKANSRSKPVITSLEEITERLFEQDNVHVLPILFAVRKPQ